MKRLLLLLGASALAATPAAAQHSGHNMPGMTMPAKKPAAKKAPASKKKATAKKPASKKASAAKKVKAPIKKQAAQPAAEPKPDSHGQHDMSQMPAAAMPADAHAGHDLAAMAAPEPPVAGPPPQALQGPENAADGVWGRSAMQFSRAFLLTKEHGGMTVAKLLIDQAETRIKGGRDGYFVNAEAWYGGDIDKLWLKTEVEGDFGARPEQAEFQALWSHAIDPWFNLQTGIRVDAEPDMRGRLVAGVEGLAPYWIEVDAAAFLSDKGDVTARLEVEHDVRITQKLILQPRGELDFALQDIPHERIGSGLSKIELGVRLRYELVPNFAPYIGLVYERALGGTASFVRADGDDSGGLAFTVGLRTWF